MWGRYCVGEGKEEKRRGVKLNGSCINVFLGGTALRECILVYDWNQER